MSDNPTDEMRQAMISNAAAGALNDEEIADLALLAVLLADPSTWAAPSTDLEDAVTRAVAEAEPAPASSEPSTHRVAHRTTNRRRRALVSAIAAAAMLAVVFGAGLVIGSSPTPDFRAQLTATGLAPGARATATVTRNDAGFRVVLDARGLPALPPGEYYQAWLKDTAGALVPIGTFSSSDGRVTLWSGVSPRTFTAMSVTIESADNRPGSSGRRVLSGEIRPG